MPYKPLSNLQLYLLQHNSHSSAPLHHHPCSGEKQPRTPKHPAVMGSPKQPPSLSSSAFIKAIPSIKQVRLQELKQATATGKAEHSRSWNAGGVLGLGREGQDFCQVMLSTICSTTCLGRCLLDLSQDSRTPTKARDILTSQESSAAHFTHSQHPGQDAPTQQGGLPQQAFSITFPHLFFFPCKTEVKDKISEAFAAEAAFLPSAFLPCHRPRKLSSGAGALPTSRQICRQLPLLSCRMSPWCWAALSAHQVDGEPPCPSPQYPIRVHILQPRGDQTPNHIAAT